MHAAVIVAKNAYEMDLLNDYGSAICNSISYNLQERKSFGRQIAKIF